MILTLIYNLLMTAIVAAAIVSLYRLRSTWAWAKACVDVLLAAVALALIVATAGGERMFTIIRLICYGLFLHEVIVLAASGVLLRRLRPKTALVSLLLAFGGAAIAIEAFLIEPHWLEVTQVRIATPKITKPMRIVVVADFQTDAIGSYERAALRRALDEKPDAILLAGDYIQADYRQRAKLNTELNAVLRELDFSAPDGVFAVRGNVDDDTWTAAFAGLPITAVDSRQSFDVGPIRLTCLSERDSFRTQVEVEDDDRGRFHIMLGHSPNFSLGNVRADLLIAGHTHGGQVRLPGIGPLLTQSELPGRYASGLRELDGGGCLYVSRGIGMERNGAPRLRFCCRPELTVIELTPE